MSNHRQQQHRHSDPQQLDLFAPTEGPAYWHAEYGRIRAHLRREVVGHDQAVDHLAVIGTQHCMGRTGQRVILVGPSGAGKTTLAHGIAGALDVPCLTIDVAALAETNWKGRDLPQAIGELARGYKGDEKRLAHAVIVLDEIDKLATATSDSGASYDYRRGKQESLLSLLGGAEVHYREPPWETGEVAWRADRALIIGAGVFGGLRRDRSPAPDDLIRLGLMPELVERMGQVIRLEPLDAVALAEVLRRGVAPAVATFAEFAYALDVSDAAVAYAAAAVADGAGQAGPRSGVTWLLAAAQRALVRLLNVGAPPGTRYALAPDDVDVPAAGARSGPPDDGDFAVAP